MTKKKHLPVVANQYPDPPAETHELCAALRQDPHALREWADKCPPAALLAACMNDVHAFSDVPPQHQLCVQAAMQMLNAVMAGVATREVLVRTQPCVQGYLEKAADVDVAFDELLRLAAGEAPFEVRKRTQECERLLGFFESPDARDTSFGRELADLDASATSLQTLAKFIGCAEDREKDVVSWLEARAAEAFLDGKDDMAQPLRAAARALRTPRQA